MDTLGTTWSVPIIEGSLLQRLFNTLASLYSWDNRQCPDLRGAHVLNFFFLMERFQCSTYIMSFVYLICNFLDVHSVTLYKIAIILSIMMIYYTIMEKNGIDFECTYVVT